MIVATRWSKGILVFVGLLLSSPHSIAVESPHKWTDYVKVDGQPLPVPKEWISTSAGRFAHNLKIPNPIAKDSGHKLLMGAREYWEHLCRSEAGDFIFESVANVEGLYLARPPRAPTDNDLVDRYRLEAAELEAYFQLVGNKPERRATLFVNPPWATYRFVEEDSIGQTFHEKFIRMSGYQSSRDPVTGKRMVVPMRKVGVVSLTSKHGLTWRGIVRTKDRENGISGAEWIIYEIATHKILGVSRSFGLSPVAKTTQEVWWLNAEVCPNTSRNPTIARNRRILFHFVSSTLRPIAQ